MSYCFEIEHGAILCDQIVIIWMQFISRNQFEDHSEEEDSEGGG